MFNLKELIFYIIIGLLVATFHFSIYQLLHVNFIETSLNSNIIAFFASIPLSYFGHFHLTFKKQTQSLSSTSKSLRVKFLITGAISFLMNNLWAWLYVDYLQWSKLIFVFSSICITPIFTFIALKFLVFRE